MSTEETSPVVIPDLPKPQQEVVPFAASMHESSIVFEHVQRVAKVFSQSKLVPEIYRGQLADCIIAIQMAKRLDIDPFTFMQNTAIVKGKPSMEGKLVIALVNARGGFAHGLRFKYTGTGDSRSVICWTTTREGEILEEKMSIADAKSWGWTSNSIWQKMPDQMLAYRSATFFARKYCPEITLGMPTKDELEDIEFSTRVSPTPVVHTQKISGPETPSSIVAEFNPGTNKEGQVQMFASPKPKARSALSEGV